MNYKNFINNEWLDADSGKTFDVINPFTEKVIAEVPASEKDVEKAVEAAQMLSKLGANDAGETDANISKDLLKHRWINVESLAKTISLEMGKPL